MTPNRLRLLIENCGMWIATVSDEFGIVSSATSKTSKMNAIQKAKDRACKKLDTERLEFIVSDLTVGEQNG